ncbi:MAG: hypothetical protein HQL99_11480 [Magnetococcales bacterium]|nr:hypothetical protein [Magnetococcales bacterium]
MNTLETITRHVVRLPEPLRVELLHYVLFLEQRIATEEQTVVSSSEERRRLLAEALDAAARLHPFRDLPDPVVWQRETRRDRPLPGREASAC